VLLRRPSPLWFVLAPPIMLASTVVPVVAQNVALAAVNCSSTIFGNSVPAVPSEDDGAPVEVGVRFRTRERVDVRAIRFFKGDGNTGVHVGHLWSEHGALLATATFTAETTSGWQEAALDRPVRLEAGATLVASYFAPNGHYAADVHGLALGRDDGSAVYALADGVGGPNGVYLYGDGGRFPTNGYLATNYYVDVVVARPPPAAPTNLAVDAVGTNGVALRWDPDPLDGSTPVAHYLVMRHGKPIASVPADTPRYSDNGLSPGTTYRYTVVAREACGNASPPSEVLTVTTKAEVETIFTGGTPDVAASTDLNPVELGVKFQSAVPGTVQSVRFFRGRAIDSGYRASLWTAEGELLATGVVVEGQSPVPGYQEVHFARPVAIEPGTTYVASYFASEGGYGFTSDDLVEPVTSGSLTALGSETSGGNGVYRYGDTSGFPTSSYRASNYWVDVVFTRT
jgi:hypothetical protein